MYRFFLAIRYLLSRPINLLGMIGIMLGVWALIVVVSIFSGFIVEVRRHLQSSTADVSAVNIPVGMPYASLREIIESDPNVAACTPRLIWQALVHPLGKGPRSAALPLGAGDIGADLPLVSILGVDPATEPAVSQLTEWLGPVEGSADPDPLQVLDPAAPFATTSSDLPGIILARQRMIKDSLVIGDRVTLTIARMQTQQDRRETKLADVQQEFEITGRYQTSYAGFDTLHVITDISALRDLFEDSEGANEIAIKLIDREDTEPTASRLQRQLNTVLATRFATIRVRSSETANVAQLSSVEHQRSLMTLVLFVIIVVAAFLMYATLSMMVTEKTHDIGILTAMGAGPIGVMTVFMACGLAIVTVGTLMGVAFGCLTSIYLDNINTFLRTQFGVDLFPIRIYNLRRVPYELDPLWILQVSSAALITGVVISALPAWRAARHDPLVSLRNE